MSKKGQNYHDATYKLFFGHKEAVADLLRDFVQTKLLTQFDFDSLERYPDTNINREQHERREDLIWRIRFKNGQWCYIYILCEFQSQNDSWMAVRILEYVAVFLSGLIRNKVIKKGQKLPPVLPIVIYNGKPKWTATQSLSKLWTDVPKSLQPFQPQQSYFLLDEGRIHPHDLTNQNSLATLFFRLERVKNKEELLQVVSEFSRRLQEPEYIELRKVITSLMISVIFKRLDLDDEIISEVHNLQEVETMLEATVRQWQRQWKKEAQKEGREEGIKQGREEGIKQGIEEGMKQGIEEGMKQGREEGIKQVREEYKTQERRRTIHNMRKRGFSLEDIASILELPLDNVQALSEPN